MRKLGLTALTLFVVAQATGCIFTSSTEEGYFDATWAVTQNTVASDCAAVGAAKVEVLSTDSGQQGYSDIFNCSALAGTTSGLPLDDYTVVENILDSADVKMNADMTPISYSITFDGEHVALANVNFDFAPSTANLTLYVDFGNAGGEANCTELGNGVGQMEVFVMDQGTSTCIAPDITIVDPSGGGTNGDTCGGIMLCEEPTVGLQLDGLPLGTYTFQVYGLKVATVPAITCYSLPTAEDVAVTGDADVTFVVPWNPLPADDAACNATKPQR